MIKNREKLIVLSILLVILLILSGIGAFKGHIASDANAIKSIGGLNGHKLGGVISRMPAGSSKIFFEGITSAGLSEYIAYDDIDEVLYALKTGRIQASWFCDVTADYLLKRDTSLRVLSEEGMADTAQSIANRFDFGMAVRNDMNGEILCEELNLALDSMRQSGKLDMIIEKYIEQVDEAQDITQEDMLLNTDELYRDLNKEPLNVGISGAVPPLELLNDENEPCNFCVAFMDEIGQLLQRRVNFVVLGNDTIFSALQSGKIDIVFCYGSSEITTEGEKKYLMTDGYYPMQKYKFIVMGGQ